jgi:KamA family protein
MILTREENLDNSIHNIEQLDRYVNFADNERRILEEIVEEHPICITKYYLSLINWNDPHDPIRKMCIPSLRERSCEGSYDTSGEHENTKLRGLQHKYTETALILATNRCATYCRHCFRKRLVGLPNNEVVERFEEATDYVKTHHEINNVLISGGDPLVLPTKTIEKMLQALSEIPHLDYIRFGSRTPVTHPHRFKDKHLLDLLKQYSRADRRIYIVTQFNHPREINKTSIEAVSRIIESGVLVDNQTVLLKGINDNYRTLAKLQNRLTGIGVNPYYVFQCRPVRRVKESFQIPLGKGIRIVEKAKALCNGHSKRFKYIMSHKTGKIEIFGLLNEEIYFKYHQARDRRNLGKIFKTAVDAQTSWLDDCQPDLQRIDMDYIPNFIA